MGVLSRIGIALDSELLKRFDRLIGIRARYPDTVRFDPAHVLDLPFIARDSTTSFRAVADINRSVSSSQLLHEALQPLVAVTGDHEHRAGCLLFKSCLTSSLALHRRFTATAGRKIRRRPLPARQP